MARKNSGSEAGPDPKVLKAAAKDMNEVMGLEPCIDCSAEPEKILSRIKEEAEDIVAKDKLSDDTWALLEQIGVAKKALAERKAKPQAEAEEQDRKAEGKSEREADGEEEEKPKKADKTKKGRKPAKEREPRDLSKSNKAIVYMAWKNGKGETDPEKLLKRVKGAVKEGTIKTWLSLWKNKKGLPAIANS